IFLMVVTRSETLAATAIAAVLESSYKVNKQPKSSTRSRSANRTSKRPPPPPPDPIHRYRTKLSKKILCNNDISTISFTDCKTIAHARSSSKSSTNSSRSSSNSSTISSSSSSSDSHSSKFTTVSSIIKRINKMEINNAVNSSSQQSSRLPQAGPILVYKS
ncbi:unnamed protein product, partial [Rotaria magnacalcarata]